ncbi:MAG TPA: hypothetical protein VNK49_00680 [Anaerolineales bacterium]|nr:hypothetical protein [Anaerolineales bacterium]
MIKKLILLMALCALLLSCGTSAPQTPPESVSVYSTFAATPWLSDLYACADSFAVITRVDDPSTADLLLRVGEPELLSSFAYQIDEEEILIAVHRQSPIQTLTLEETQTLFAGVGDPSVQVWVYASVEDVQRVFDQLVMKGRSVASSAKIAISPSHMSDVLSREIQAVGILPRRWMIENVREVYAVGVAPVLAITPDKPEDVIARLIGCLQSK